MRTAVLAVTLFLLAGNVLAEPQPWMKQDNPNELSVSFAAAEACRAPDEIYTSIVRGVLTRSRIKSDPFDVTSLLFVVDVQCGQDFLNSVYEFTFHVSVFFGKRTADGDLTVYYPGYGLYGVDNEGGLQDSLKAVAENAITDYLRANFDL